MNDQTSPPAEAPAPDSSDEVLRRLARMLDFAEPGRFTLAFAKCNLPTQRRALVEQLNVLIDPLGVALLEVELTDPVERLLPILQERLAGTYLSEALPAEPTPTPETEGAMMVRERQNKVAIFVHGLEHSLPSTDSNPPLLAHLNLSRELFRREVACPLVLWLPDYAVTMLARGAPDFWAWRSGVYEFPPEPETAERVADQAVYDGAVSSSLSAEAKRERLHLLARLLEDYRELGAGPRERRTQADILWKMGHVHQDLGAWAEAREHYEQALALARSLDEQRSTAGLLHQLAMLAQDTGNPDEARRLYDQSLQIKRELGDKRGIAISLHQLGRLAQNTGDLQQARRLYDQSMEIKRELGDRAGEAKTLNTLANIASAEDDQETARRLLSQSLMIAQKLSDKLQIAYASASLALVEEKDGNLAAALSRIRQAERLFAELGSPMREQARRDRERMEAGSG